MHLLPPTALLDDTFDSIPPTIATGGAFDDVASDFPGSARYAGTSSSPFGDFGCAIGFRSCG